MQHVGKYRQLTFRLHKRQPSAAAMTALSLLLALQGAIHLTPSNWKSMTSGKSTFVKFLAPWNVPLPNAFFTPMCMHATQDAHGRARLACALAGEATARV